MPYKIQMNCKIVASFYDGTAEVILAWPQGDAQHPQENLLTGNVSLRMNQASAAAFVPGKSYTLTIEEVAQVAEPEEKAPVITLVATANSEKDDTGMTTLEANEALQSSEEPEMLPAPEPSAA